MFELRTLGTLDLRSEPEGRRVLSILAQPKRAALLVYLALAGARGRARDSLLAMFWPELRQSSARHALNQALHVLRGALGEAALLSVGGQVVLTVEVVRCDALALEQALAAGRVEEALELYRGEFLEGFHPCDGPAFERWIDGERERLARLALEGVLGLAEREQQAGNPAGAARWLDRARTLVPCDEQVLAHTVRALAAAGDRSGAVREYEAFVRRLREDLELEPSAEQQALLESIRGVGSALENAAVRPAAGRATPPTVSAGEATREEPTVAAERAGERADTAVPLPQAFPTRVSRLDRRRAPLLATAALVVLLGLGAAAYLASRALRRDAAPPVDLTRVLVTNFHTLPNDTALHALARLTADWVAQRLAQTAMVTVIPAAEELHRLGLQGLPPSAPDLAAVRSLAERSRAGAIVSGSILVQGDSLLLQARITNAATGELLRAVGPVAAGTSDPAAAAEVLAQQVIGALSTVLDIRLAAWAGSASQPPSLQAYRAYADALDRFFATDVPNSQREAAELLRQTAALDTTFTAPLLWAMFAYRNSGQIARADSLVQVLEPARDRLPPWDRAVLDFQRAHMRSDGDTDTATSGNRVRVRTYETARRVAELTPGSEWQYLLGLYALRLNRPREAVQALERTDPQRGWLRHWPSYWYVLVEARHLLGDHEQELTEARKAQALHPRDPALPQTELRALVALGRVPQALERTAELLTAAEPQILPREVYWTLAFELRVHGYGAESRRVAERAVAWYRSLPAEERQSLLARYMHGHMLYLAEHYSEARELLTQLVEEEHRSVGPTGLLGVIAAAEGDRDTTQWALDRLDTLAMPAEARFLQTQWRAAIVAQLGDLDGAVALLREALSQGLYVGIRSHEFVPLEPLYAHPPFQALMRPKG